MGVRQRVLERVAIPAGIRVLQWRHHPMALLLREDVRCDPYPNYARLRAGEPVRTPGAGFSAVGTHAAASEVLKDHNRFCHDLSLLRKTSVLNAAAATEVPEAVPRNEELFLLMDPPEHTRLRRLVSAAFAPRAVDALEPWIQDVADDLVRPELDVVQDLAFPLAVRVICQLLGVPDEDHDRLRTWGTALASSLDLQTTTDEVDRSRRAMVECVAYLEDLIEDHRRSPRDDLLTRLVDAAEEGDRLNARELVATCMLLLIAGFETTVNLVGNGTLALLAHPDQLAALRSDESLLPNAVDELLRYDSPVQLTSRVVRDDTTVAGHAIAGGQELIVFVGAANRDPAVFDDPDRLDVRRPNAADHLSFSVGVHHCVGARLARLEARCAFRALLRLGGTLEQTGPEVRRPLMVLRGLDSLPVRAA